MALFFKDDFITLHNDGVIAGLNHLESESVQTVVTSPPYWGLRDYDVAGQIGLEKTPEEYIGKMVEVFRAVHRVLKPDGTLWLNLGDSYANDGKFGGETSGRCGRWRPCRLKRRISPRSLKN